jgi:hypothetical protein
MQAIQAVDDILAIDLRNGCANKKQAKACILL